MSFLPLDLFMACGAASWYTSMHWPTSDTKKSVWNLYYTKRQYQKHTFILATGTGPVYRADLAFVKHVLHQFHEIGFSLASFAANNHTGNLEVVPALATINHNKTPKPTGALQDCWCRGPSKMLKMQPHSVSLLLHSFWHPVRLPNASASWPSALYGRELWILVQQMRIKLLYEKSRTKVTPR